MNAIYCEHLKTLKEIKTAQRYVCEECVQSGGKWVHLRTCQTCGATLCCDSSPNKHASRHAISQQHPVAVSAEPGETWAWCYEHRQLMEY